MGAPDSGMQAADQPAAETLLTAFRTITDEDRAPHASVLSYWLSIRGDKDTPALQDLDPLQISDAGPSSILLELIGGGQDAEIRHLGEKLRDGAAIQRIIDAPNPSVLTCIARKLPIVAISREFLAFEDSFETAEGPACCWVTLLPLSSCGSWVDYVYAFVSVATNGAVAAKAPEPVETAEAAEVGQVAEVAAAEEAVPELLEVIPIVPDEEPADVPETATDEPVETPAAKSPGFAKLIDGFANLAGFYGQGIKAEDVVKVDIPSFDPPAPEPPAAEDVASEPPLELEEAVVEPPAEPEETFVEPVVPEPVELEPPADELPVDVEPEPQQQEIAPEPAPVLEGALLIKLTDVRAKADEARMAQLRATAALHEGLSAAYDFAIDAEASPEEYLRLVEAQGLKIQLRAPMAPVVKLAFTGLADELTIADLETVLAWALKQELPRGSLAQRIEEAGGIDALLNGTKAP